MKIGTWQWEDPEKAYLMGILNVTPDSFSDGGRYQTIERACARARQMIEEGADILDIGGESTRPGSRPVTIEEEQERVLPVVEAIGARFDIPISVDTYHAETAEAALQAGAHLINDIWGLQYDQGQMAQVIASHQAACCLMHNSQTGQYQEVTGEVKSFLQRSLEIARKAGISREGICIDPGIGFGKTTQENLSLLKHLDRLTDLEVPVLLGTSRKSVIGNTLLLPVEERVLGTAATSVLGYLKGCRIFRVHDVKEQKQALEMTMAVCSAP